MYWENKDSPLEQIVYGIQTINGLYILNLVIFGYTSIMCSQGPLCECSTTWSYVLPFLVVLDIFEDSSSDLDSPLSALVLGYCQLLSLLVICSSCWYCASFNLVRSCSLDLLPFGLPYLPLPICCAVGSYLLPVNPLLWIIYEADSSSIASKERALMS